MRTIARAFLVAALAGVSACENPGVTKPTTPTVPAGTPQSLKLTATPTTIDYTGTLVHVTAAVTVEPGAKPPITLSVQMPGSPTASMLALRGDGTLDQHFWIASGGDLVARAGKFEERVTITRGAQPQPPDNPPPPPSPQPTPLPNPEPTPPTVTLVLTPKVVAASGPTDPLRVNQFLVFSVAVDALPGGVPLAGLTLTYDWIVRDGFTTVAMGTANPQLYKVTQTGTTSAGVTVTASDGRQAYARVDFTVVP